MPSSEVNNDANNNPEQASGPMIAAEDTINDNDNNAVVIPAVADQAAAVMGGGEDELAPYFNTLIDTLHRSNDAQSASASAASAGLLAGSNNNNNNSSTTSPQLQSSVMISLLHNGAEQIATAIQKSALFAENNNNTTPFQRDSTFFATDTILGSGDNNTAQAAAAVFPANYAAVYLYAVAQNILGLEEVLLAGGRNGGSLLLSNMDNNAMVDGGIDVKAVVEIVSAASIAAIFCNSRDTISKTGILPALSYLLRSDGARSLSSLDGSSLHTFTPFHPEFIQLCLLAGQYRYAQSFLHSHPVQDMTLQYSNQSPIVPTMYLRYHYYAGLVHIGCDDWNSALDSFYLCMTIPCQTVSAISVAARKKSLLIDCILLESEELDGDAAVGDNGMKMGNRAIESKVMSVPGAVSPVLERYLNKSSSNRVGGGDEEGMLGRTLAAFAGADTSEQPRGLSSRRRVHHHRAASNISSDGGGDNDDDDDDGGAAAAAEEGGGEREQNGKNYPQLGRYHKLVSTYISGNAKHYATVLTGMADLLRIDGNLGLAKRLEGRLVYRAVRQKASVYSVTRTSALEETLRDVCSNLGSTAGGEMAPRRIEDLVMSMAALDWDDHLVADPFVAKLDHSTNMVSFLDEDPNRHNVANVKLEKDLVGRLASCTALANRVRHLDIALTKSSKYKMHAMKQKKIDIKSFQQGQTVADLGGAMDISGSDWHS